MSKMLGTFCAEIKIIGVFSKSSFVRMRKCLNIPRAHSRTFSLFLVHSHTLSVSPPSFISLFPRISSSIFPPLSIPPFVRQIFHLIKCLPLCFCVSMYLCFHLFLLGPLSSSMSQSSYLIIVLSLLNSFCQCVSVPKGHPGCARYFLPIIIFGVF